MKIVIDEDIPFVSGRFPENVEVVSLPGKEIKPDDVKDADALIVRTRTRCDAALLKGSKVKLVATATIGTDHIDTQWCEENGITVRNAPGSNAPGVAQYLFASLFRAGFNPGKDSLGIIGYGNVGKIVAEWAKEMGIRVMVSDAPLKAQGLNDIDYMEMEDVLKEADAVTLHVPFTTTGDFPTFKLIGTPELELMKTGAILVNSSRGGVVDEKALKPFLRRGNLISIVDVWENEPTIDPELLSLVKFGTPHIAGYSAEGKKRATRMVLQSVNEIFGVPVDLSGLECLPEHNKKITPELILESYDPQRDFSELKEHPEKFELLRNRYNYRHEPFFI